MAGSSGEEKTRAATTVSTSMTTSAMTNSLTRSYRRVGNAWESGAHVAPARDCRGTRTAVMTSPPAGGDGLDVVLVGRSRAWGRARKCRLDRHCGPFRRRVAGARLGHDERRLLSTDRRYDAVAADEQYMQADDDSDDQRQQRHVPEHHLPQVHHVEVRADAGGVESVLGLGADPLRVEVGLDEVSGERRSQ